MKLIFENFRNFVNEGRIEDKHNFGNIIIDYGLITKDKRHIVVAKTMDGPMGFYRSTGTGTGDWTKGMYLPFGGYSPDGPAGANAFWLAKMSPSHPQSGNKSSKVPKEDSELGRINAYLKEKFPHPYNTKTPEQWMEQNGYLSTEELGIKPDPIFGNPLYEAISVNTFLNHYGALGALGGDYRWYGFSDIYPRDDPSRELIPKSKKR